ncbi:MAG: DNA repair protein RadA, partial [Microbacterium sp.]
VVERTAPKSRVQAGPVTQKALPIGEIPIEDSHARTSGVAELDRVLGGGLVPGAAILLAGEPGVGKSTLLLEVAAQTAAQKHRTLYLTGEESAAQVRLRADRTGGIQDELYLAAETDLGAVLGHVEQVKPTLLVIDSIQTISASDIDGVPGGVTQVKEVAAALIRMAKLRNITLVLVGHVTKDGSIAGPRVLEHLVDVVLHFEGERSSRLRMVRAVKNRFGPVDEVGCFDLSAAGIVAITDPTGLFLDTRNGSAPGTCVAVAMEGRRPLLSEVQALVTHSAAERPRRTTSGVDSARVAMILAVLQQHAGIRLHSHDVFVSSVGGARLTEPSNDLAIALAIVSAYRGRPLGRQ